MIKTIAYNDFSGITNKNDFENLIEEFKAFKLNGGNLNLPVSEYSTSAPISFFNWMEKRFSDSNNPEKLPNYIKRLIEEELIPNPFQFLVNKKERTITEVEGFGLHWMKSNMEQYHSLILDALKKLVIDIEDWDLGLDYFIFGNIETVIKNRRSLDRIIENESIPDVLPKFHYTDSNQKTYLEKIKHPLIKIIEELKSNKFDFAKALEIIFTASKKQNYTSIWKQNRELFEYHLEIKNDSIARIFYKYDIHRDYFENEHENNVNKSFLKEMIIDAIYHDDVDFIKEHITKFNIPELESTQPSYDLFLNKTCSKEMSKILIQNNAMIHGKIQEDHASVFYHEYFRDYTLDAILEEKEEFRKKIKEEPEFYYNYFFKSDRQKTPMSIINLLVEKYDFPLKDFEFIYLAKNEENLQWFLEHGADPRKCGKFMITQIARKADGLKYLKKLQKDSLFNSFYPDPIFHILSSSTTKDFSSWINKAPSEIFSRYTHKGIPAWWGFNTQNGWEAISPHVKDFSQLSKDGLSWFFYRVVKNQKSYDFKESEYFLKMVSKSKDKDFKIDISGVDPSGKNVLHHFFMYKPYSREELNQTNLLSSVLKFTDNNIVDMLLKEDNESHSVLSYIMDFNSNTKYKHNFNQILSELIEPHLNSLPLDKKLNVTITKHDKMDSQKNTQETKIMTVLDICIELLPHKKEELNYIKINNAVDKSIGENKKVITKVKI